ncbi:hypothetical protein G5I_04144 [Acromyrmex echinatior]|uniref:Uncharacterized protein n=1 Tax=Acromyrmex echinatior TaxID=103372 RepID=F4WEU5_ACREC|nr:hypothetical protein G5I_04144 [Acromyrmex echinatior]
MHSGHDAFHDENFVTTHSLLRCLSLDLAFGFTFGLELSCYKYIFYVAYTHYLAFRARGQNVLDLGQSGLLPGGATPIRGCPEGNRRMHMPPCPIIVADDFNAHSTSGGPSILTPGVTQSRTRRQRLAYAS